MFHFLFAHLSDEEQNAINSIPLSNEREADWLAWPYEKSDFFTVMSGCHKIHKSNLKPSIQHPNWCHSICPAV